MSVCSGMVELCIGPKRLRFNRQGLCKLQAAWRGCVVRRQIAQVQEQFHKVALGIEEGTTLAYPWVQPRLDLPVKSPACQRGTANLVGGGVSLGCHSVCISTDTDRVTDTGKVTCNELKSPGLHKVTHQSYENTHDDNKNIGINYGHHRHSQKAQRILYTSSVDGLDKCGDNRVKSEGKNNPIAEPGNHSTCISKSESSVRCESTAQSDGSCYEGTQGTAIHNIPSHTGPSDSIDRSDNDCPKKAMGIHPTPCQGSPRGSRRQTGQSPRRGSAEVGNSTSLWDTTDFSPQLDTKQLEGVSMDQLEKDRRQTVLELYWVQQAIHSRKQYLHFKEQLADQAV